MTYTGETPDEELRSALGRLVRQLVKEEHTERRGTPMLPVLDAHFGQPADDLPVVQESVETPVVGCSGSEAVTSGTTAR